MEAIKFLKEYRRMCKSHTACIGCPLENTGCNIPDSTEERLQEIIRVTEQWNKERPIITNAQKLKEVFGGEAIYAISSQNVQALKDWLDEPYKEP